MESQEKPNSRTRAGKLHVSVDSPDSEATLVHVTFWTKEKRGEGQDFRFSLRSENGRFRVVGEERTHKTGTFLPGDPGTVGRGTWGSQLTGPCGSPPVRQLNSERAVRAKASSLRDPS